VDWALARERLAGPMFAPLHPALARLPQDRWPTLEALSALAGDARTASGRSIRFVPNDPAGPGPGYEPQIFMTGDVPTRRDNWHDLFNALCWIAWPRTKARINAQHVALIEEKGAVELRRRGPERDALTLFDEGGVLVASSDPALPQMIRDFRWKALFWERRQQVAERLAFFVVGHGCYEQALAPYVGMVAKTVFVTVEPAFARLPVAAQVAHADALAATFFESRAHFASPRALAPMPVLGVPGWHFAAQDEAFYDDASHFHASRPDPRRRTGRGL
jgi:hypothetical protein